ncbi:hypothetical protein LGK95_19000 [Clostridium algoriphilum]|uniref:tetratricopeptide repeat protein n=1 Tax=Clostridium algoriphilum TaxID=198347 RepID=UPI001CF1B252|nr:tetratricopeptide repeat protein [Clostridium algoriphilum]MCB2295570.1 hypothetical protein [Clostridium algoriphilum]
MKSKSLNLAALTFAVISAIGIGIAFNALLKNSNLNNSKVISTNNKTETSSYKKKEIKRQKVTDTQSKNQQLTKNKQEELEKMWKTGYDQFFKQEYKQAIATERQVIKEDPNFYKAYTVEGIALAYSGNFNKGMEQINHALKLKPNYGYGMFNKALANELFGNYDEAIKWYKKDLEVEKFVWSYYGIASIYGRKGDINNAIKYLKLAIDINPNIKNVAKTEDDFNNVHKYTEFKKLIFNADN